MNIVALSFELRDAVETFAQKAKYFFYRVMLMGHSCPQCSHGLVMTAESRCKCRSCGYEFDPTVVFQRCSGCVGIPVLRIRRYFCRGCGAEIGSRYLFEGMVFDREYFAGKMADSRQRKAKQREHIRQMLADNHSGPLAFEAMNLHSVPGLVETLNGLTQGSDEPRTWQTKARFDLHRYQKHVTANIDAEPIKLHDIPPIIRDVRLDLIWRFVATVFLEHYGQVDMRQEDWCIWVSKHDDRKGQDFFDGTTEFGGVKRSLD